MERVLLLLATLCALVTSGVGVSHALQRSPKRRLEAPLFVQVQNTICNRYGLIAGAADEYPHNWTHYRDRWAALHTLRLIAAMTALTLLLIVLSTRSAF